MGTKVGVGSSTSRSPHEAGREAAMKALEQSGCAKPDFVFVFATVGYDQDAILHAIREATSGAPLSGCSGEGIITLEMAAETNFCVCVMAIASDELRFQNVRVEKVSPPEFGGALLATEIRPLLSSDTLTCLLFPDGFAFDFDPFRQVLERSLGLDRPLPLFGGLSADNWITRKSFQYHNDQAFSGGMSAVVVSGTGDIAWGISHGCIPIGTRHTITRSSGNIIYEIDGVPALQVLNEYVEELNWKEQWNKISLNLSLGFRSPDTIKEDYGEYVVRYIVDKNDQDGSVMIQSDVSDGTQFWMVRRDKDLIRDGLQEISRQLHEKARGRTPKLVMQFECMGRGKVVFREQERADLIRTLQEQVGDAVPWIGFYTYGEIGPVSGYNCIHNFTAVLAAFF